jgi:hypothetical protein
MGFFSAEKNPSPLEKSHRLRKGLMRRYLIIKAEFHVRAA